MCFPCVQGDELESADELQKVVTGSIFIFGYYLIIALSSDIVN